MPESRDWPQIHHKCACTLGGDCNIESQVGTERRSRSINPWMGSRAGCRPDHRAGHGKCILKAEIVEHKRAEGALQQLLDDIASFTP